MLRGGGCARSNLPESVLAMSDPLCARWAGRRMFLRIIVAKVWADQLDIFMKDRIPLCVCNISMTQKRAPHLTCRVSHHLRGCVAVMWEKSLWFS